MILVIDNYDSFTYNLVQYLGELGAELQVYRNDAICLDEIRKFQGSYLSCTSCTNIQYQAAVKLHGVFPSCRG